MVGNSNRLTNINRMASPKTETHNHHQAPRAGTVNDTNAIVVATAIAADDRRIAAVDAGQGVGMVTEVAPVGEVIDRLCTGARELLAGWSQTART